MRQIGSSTKIVAKRKGAPRASMSATGARPAKTPAAAPESADIFPFALFDENARGVLTAAQMAAKVEALEARPGLIGPEHLLLGLIYQRKGGAAPVLRALGVRAAAVRARLKTKGLKRVDYQVGSIVPAPSTRRVIKQAMLEATQRGRQEVGTEHLLMGILSQTTQPAARVLDEMGVTADRSNQLLNLQPTQPVTSPANHIASPPEESLTATNGLAAALRIAHNAAAKEKAAFVRSDHLLSRLVARDSTTPAVLGLLQAVGADLEELRRRLRPPRRVTRLEDEISTLRSAQRAAISLGDTELADQMLGQEKGLRDHLARALDAWNDRWAELPIY